MITFCKFGLTAKPWELASAGQGIVAGDTLDDVAEQIFATTWVHEWVHLVYDGEFSNLSACLGDPPVRVTSTLTETSQFLTPMNLTGTVSRSKMTRATGYQHMASLHLREWLSSLVLTMTTLGRTSSRRELRKIMPSLQWAYTFANGSSVVERQASRFGHTLS